MGDHRAWQKESFFDASNHIPFLVSWPAKLPKDERRDELVCLTDLFGIATGAAGETETRDGSDVLGMLAGEAEPRKHVIGLYGGPGRADFKIMVREGDWKYIYIANGGREQLFNLADDPSELDNRVMTDVAAMEGLRATALDVCSQPEADGAVENGKLRAFPFEERERKRIYQFDRSRGVEGFPERPEDVLKGSS